MKYTYSHIPKPKRGTNRERRKWTRKLYRQLSQARKAGLYTNFSDLDLSTKGAAKLIKEIRQSSRNFLGYRYAIQAERDFSDAIMYADY
jgi:hypothetical protein